MLLLSTLCFRRESWSSYNTYKMWQTLLETTRRQSHDHSVLADIYGNIMVSKLADLMDDMQRVHKKVSEPSMLSNKSYLIMSAVVMKSCLQCFDAFGWVAERASGP